MMNTVINHKFFPQSLKLIMPYLMSIMLSGQFFEVLVGGRAEPLWRLLSRIGLLYMLEPVFTVLFVVNMITVWEKVMSTVRAQIFRRVLIQKVNLAGNWNG